MDQPAPSDEIIETGLLLADSFPQLVAEHEPLVDNIISALERLLQDAERARVLQKVAGDNPETHAMLVAQSSRPGRISRFTLLSGVRSDSSPIAFAELLAQAMRT